MSRWRSQDGSTFQEYLDQLKRQQLQSQQRRQNLFANRSQSVSDDKTVVPGFIRGYRIWSRGLGVDLQPYLYAVAHPRKWPPGEVMEAGCDHIALGTVDHDAPPPFAGCRCGLYAKYLPQNLRGPFMGARNRIPGIIDAWGNTILGTFGFRAQKAVIRALWVEPTIEPFIRAAGDFYQVPVFDTLEEAVEAYPPTDVSELVDIGNVHDTWMGAGRVPVIALNVDVSLDSRYRELYEAAIRKAFNLPPTLIPGEETP